MRRFAFIAALVLTAAAFPAVSHAQTGHHVNLTWSDPAPSGAFTGCTLSQPCTYILYRASLPAGTASCPAATDPSFVPLNPGSPVSGDAYTDYAAGLTVCYYATTVWQGQASSPSTAAGPLVVPANPIITTPRGAMSIIAKLGGR